MEYVLKQFDTPLLRFSATTDTSEPEINILWHDAEKVDQLPLDLSLTPESLSKWLRHRTIPKNRAYVHSFLAKCNLNLNRPMSIISVCKALSLNDCYWVAEEGDDSQFAKILPDLQPGVYHQWDAAKVLATNRRENLSLQGRNGGRVQCWI